MITILFLPVLACIVLVGVAIYTAGQGGTKIIGGIVLLLVPILIGGLGWFLRNTDKKDRELYRRSLASKIEKVSNDYPEEVRRSGGVSALEAPELLRGILHRGVPGVSVLFGLLLIALGVWDRWGGDLGLWEPLGFAAPEKLSHTALIPAYVGMALVVLGLLALKESLLKHAMHFAAMIGVLGLLAALVRIIITGKIAGVGGTSLLCMTLLCAVFVALCVNSFIQARRRRRAL